jgi:pimeloyl-ACP methyl ester carboxylesterase
MRTWCRVGAALLFATACIACAADGKADATPTRARESEALVPIDDSTRLAGTLTRPAAHTSGETLAAVLLISGSGPQDRDGSRPELPGYAPWRDVSEALAAQGIAVLRLDDRGTGRSTGQFAGATTDDFARDAAAAVAWLRRQPGIDPQRVGLVGHSEGAVVALLVARADSAVRALVLLGAPSRPGREIARWQRQELVSGDLARWPVGAQRAVLAAAESAAESVAVRDAWLRRWFALDPREVAAGVRQPVLLVHGNTDRQVPPSHADELAAVLRQAGAEPVQVQHLRDTDHLLLADVDGDPQGYVRLAERRVRASAISATTHFLSIHMAAR